MPLSPTVLVVMVAIGAACSPAAAQERAGHHYLPDGAVDLVRVLPPAPVRGTPRYDGDRRTFRDTRGLLATARGRNAVQDAKEDVPSLFADFAAAAGRPLTPERYPLLATLLATMRPDVAGAVNRAKDSWQRRRPFLIDGGPICQPRERLAASYDYPSGHTAWGTSVALVLAELLPDRATAILERGRAYGDSRYICGAHNLSAVEAGRWAAAAVVARLHGDAAFRRDLDAARAELARGE